MDFQSSPLHAVLVSGPGLGHVNSSLLLAESLISAGFSVTLVCFARSYSTHASRGRVKPPHPSVRLEIVPDGLSPEAANYVDLFVTTSAMQEGLERLIQRLGDERLPATCIISDSYMAWTQDVADKFGVPRVAYWTATATSYLCILAIPELISGGYAGSKGTVPSSWKSKSPVLLDCVPGFPEFPLDEVPKEFRSVDVDTHPMMRQYLRAAARAKDARSVLIHSVYDLERKAFEGLKEIGMEAYAIGPLLHHNVDSTAGNNKSAEISLTWLDGQVKSSVIYVSCAKKTRMEVSHHLVGNFFSHTAEEEMSELAHGLEASGQPFLWVIRSDAIVKGQLSDVLPHGFESRTAQQGLIVPWAPQIPVLAHPALGGFLSHCGWNSTLESLWMGVPILACPRGAEQPTNCRLITQDWGVGIELERTEDGAFSRQHVETGIRTLMCGTLGQKAQTNARHLQEVLRKVPVEGGHSHSNLLKFASDLKGL